MLIKLFLLPGFLGVKEDFKNLNLKNSIDPIFVNPYSFSDPLEGMDYAASQFIKTVSKKNKNILLGYSMGGRFALHSLKKEPNLFHGAIFISTHPGLTNQKEKEARYLSDQKWASAFVKTSWIPLMKKWNGQSVFYGNFVERKEEDYSRKMLVNTFEGFSLAKQENFHSFLKEIKCPLLWITGAKDDKFSHLASSLEFSNSCSEKIEVKNAGHRVHLEAPFELSKIVDTFLQKIL